MAETDTDIVPSSEGVRTAGGRTVTGATVVLEAMYAVLAISTVILFGMGEAGLLDKEVATLAQHFDNFVCLVFISQAMWNLWHAPNKKRWARWGWADILASIPDVEWLRPLRWVRLILLVRAMRSTIRSVQGIAVLFNADRAQTVVAIVFALIVVSLATSSFLILGMESPHPKSNIDTAEQALLWSVATLFGAEQDGFGGHHPVTTGGQVINLWLVIVSLGLIGSLAGLISAWIEEEPDPEKLRSGR